MKSIWDKIKNWNDADSFNSSVPLEYNDADLDLSDKRNNVIFHFIIVFIANAIKYNARNVKD